MEIIRTLSLFVVTALAGDNWLLSAISLLERRKVSLAAFPRSYQLSIFVWLLTLHPQAAGRVYAAYGGISICVALDVVVGDRCNSSGYR